MVRCGWGARVGALLMVLPAFACSGGDSRRGAEAGGAAPADSTFEALPVEAGSTSGEVVAFRGMMTYLADAPRFTDCVTGASWAMAQEADYVSAERAYLDAGAWGEPLLVTFQGRVTRRPGREGGEVDAVVVTDFGGTEPGRGCGGGPVEGRLEGTEWRLVALPGASPVPPGAEATLLLDRETGVSSGSTGCNRFTGAYDLAGGRLTVSVSALTRIRCPEPLAALEADFLEALRLTGVYRFVGGHLELLGEPGLVARFTPAEG